MTRKAIPDSSDLWEGDLEKSGRPEYSVVLVAILVFWSHTSSFPVIS